MPQRSSAPPPATSATSATSAVSPAPAAGGWRGRVPGLFRVVAVIEALTWAGLLVGMYLEHVAGVTDLGVWLFGRLHGAAFLAYLAATALAWRALRWSPGTLVLAVAASVPPLATAVFEVWARRTGRLAAGDPLP